MSWQDFLILILAQWAALALILAGGWTAWKLTRNSGWIDVTWTFAVGLVGALSAFFWAASADSLNHLVVGAMITAWALRLGLYIAGRTTAISDDPRYAKLISDWGDAADGRMFAFLQAQAFFGVPLTMAVALAAANPAPLWSPAPLLAVAVFLVAIAGSAAADLQLARFKAMKQAGATDKRVCDIGLWSYSRHPNYFFEVVIWASFAIFALDVSGRWDWGFAALLAPACMYWLLRYVSGVPPLEEHMVARYGEAYRDYQRRVSVFFPWPPSSRSSRSASPLTNPEG